MTESLDLYAKLLERAGVAAKEGRMADHDVMLAAATRGLPVGEAATDTTEPLPPAPNASDEVLI